MSAPLYPHCFKTSKLALRLIAGQYRLSTQAALLTYWLTEFSWWLTEHSGHLVFVYISLFILAPHFQPVRSHQLSIQLMVPLEALFVPRGHSSVNSKPLNRQQQSMVSSFSVPQWCPLYSQPINKPSNPRPKQVQLWSKAASCRHMLSHGLLLTPCFQAQVKASPWLIFYCPSKSNSW